MGKMAYPLSFVMAEVLALLYLQLAKHWSTENFGSPKLFDCPLIIWLSQANVGTLT